jgi:hypothetical protein
MWTLSEKIDGSRETIVTGTLEEVMDALRGIMGQGKQLRVVREGGRG